MRFVKGKKIKNGGWHFSYIGNLENVRYKMHSIVEQQVNTVNKNNDKLLLEKIRNNEDILERGDIFANLEMSNIFPQYFIANKNQVSFSRAMWQHRIYKIKKVFKCL